EGVRVANMVWKPEQSRYEFTPAPGVDGPKITWRSIQRKGNYVGSHKGVTRNHSLSSYRRTRSKEVNEMTRDIIILGEKYNIQSLDNVFDELSGINFDKTATEEIDKLDEDLLMISYLNGDLIDVGWYPSFEVPGAFKIYIIKNGDWENPFFEEVIPWDVEVLRNKIKESIKKLKMQ
ncbi:hypothetical protein ACLEEK_12705, partial [Lonsdalea quercina]|uniref:hypothetical protein n=2 Tax=Lonsdalea quercina TaxID=71657 RepID=UPI003974E4FF